MLLLLPTAMVPRRGGATVAVALVDEGYPEAPLGTGRISHTERLDGLPGVWIVYAGVGEAPDGWSIAGGRAAYVCAEHDSVEAARQRAYAAISRLGGSGWRFRRDIATLTASSRC